MLVGFVYVALMFVNWFMNFPCSVTFECMLRFEDMTGPVGTTVILLLLLIG